MTKTSEAMPMRAHCAAEQMFAVLKNACNMGTFALSPKCERELYHSFRGALMQSITIRRAGFGGRKSGLTADTPCPADSLFFQLCCSNRSAVQLDSRLHCSDIAILHGLGGQHGEEEKDEDESSGEEDGEEDKAPEEEVGRFAIVSFEARLRHMSRRGRGEIATRPPKAAPAQVDE
jgi:hypothetical protein